MENKISKRIGILYFSPTNTTRKICDAIALGMGANAPVDLNITKPEFRKEFISNANTILEDINFLIIGAPVYEGKLPVQVIESLKVSFFTKFILKKVLKKATVQSLEPHVIFP